MNTSASGIALIQSFEACAETAYVDADGVWTIGWGHTNGVNPGDTCTAAQASEWLREDLMVAEQAVNQLVTATLNQNQFDALVSLVFNIGVDAFRNSTLLRDLNAGNYTAAANWIPQWDHADGIEIAGLERRRLAEQTLFNTP